MSAFGLASLLDWGTSWSDWRFLSQMSPRSLAVSGVNGRSIGLIEAR